METKKIELNKDVARKVLEVVDAGLVNGLGVAEPGKMCVEAAVCYAMGLPHSDKPSCVGSAVRSFKIRLNDARWPTDADRTKGMRKLAIAQLGSDTIDQREFASIVSLKTIQRIVPMAMRYAVEKGYKLTDETKVEIEASAKACEDSTNLDIGREASTKARDLMRKVRAADAAADAAAAAAAAYADAAYAAAAAAAAADAAAAYAAAAADAYRLKVLNCSAQIGLEALIELKSPGCEWLDLCE